MVDDEPAIRGVLCEFLDEWGFQTLSAASGDEARGLLEAGARVDLVFSDVRMPGELDGYGLARWVLQRHPGLPVILVSGDLGAVNAAEGLTGVETCAKPYDFEAAAHRIAAAIARRVQ